MQDTSIATPAPARRRRKPAAEAAGTAPRRRRASGAALRQLPINFVGRSKLNPRTTFDAAEIAELAASIRQDGILQPLLVRPTPATAGLEGERYEIIAGERRWRAAGQAGLMEVPAIVRSMSDLEVMRAMVVENVQRASLSPLEECAGYRALLDADPDATPDRIAEMVGRSRSWIYQRLQLGKLEPEPLEALRKGRITAGHAVEIARLGAADQRSIRAVLACLRDETRHDVAARQLPSDIDPLHEAAYRAVFCHSHHRPGVEQLARTLGLTLDRQGRPVEDSNLAEAPGSRTQPPRASGERPVLKTGRATGPHSLPCETRVGVRRTSGAAHPASAAHGDRQGPCPWKPYKDDRSETRVLRGRQIAADGRQGRGD